ncbi:hypothetical protein NEMBOFW57_008585 [Staphylotrichum longicolle]|uniref:Heterokaryon incompatibility domain-containing protein n=1 Tax=Staphylotrichum longicolle TaxID=669026 RepID=A0AAD4HVZ3_9PEZI|nr:hypothetical protein NEMBOFW57_008585 [Staphylotrichum longicolle]
MTPSLGPPIPKTEEFIGSQIPPYAILSHTWDVDEPEVTLQQLLTSPAPALYAKAGFRKITQACALAAARDSLAYAWVDTCCIDKTSSAELSEAINSMYAWYRGAAVCYVFLADLKPGTAEDLERDLGRCRWFTRGWTLQELIAPREVVFFDKTWACRGSKGELAPLLTRITGIPERVLRLEAELGTFSVAQRMSWAARRETTRVEDTAYCLLGLFDVHMSLIYGEGMKAFARLQTTIVQSTADLSIFAWVEDRVPCPLYAGMLAESPRQFAACADIEPALGDSAYSDFAITTRGIQTEASLVQELDAQGRLGRTALDTFCHIKGGMMVGTPGQLGGAICSSG